MFRNVIISVTVVIFLIIALGFTWLSLMRSSQENAIRDVQLFQQITRPNVNQSGVQNIGNSLFEGVLYFNQYKEIEGIPVNWGDHVVTYSLFGGVSRLTGDHSPIQLLDPSDGQMRYYDRETKQRIMEFYHPEVEYRNIRNDLEQLEQMTGEKYIEMAISFDQSYTAEQVRTFLPENVSLKWLWADTYTDVESLREINTVDGDGEEYVVPAFPELADRIYGFSERPDGQSKGEEWFVQAIEQGIQVNDGKYYREFERIYQYLRGDSQSIDTTSVKVLGAVVTGTSEQLEVLKEMEQVRSSVFGVMAERF
ncbi:anti-sigma factor [Alkalihalobacillus sp. MEB203]|uniref:Anti-sigma factor n=2 Tax=Alkalihalobacterium chitinilyticum TaxID=2980103 RepID=A0ABT5VCW8_9BACI|nr:anti-sigma factor [Alkalihalobacterium chitinilyticum]